MHNILNIKSKVSDYCLGFINNIEDIEQHIDKPNTITFIDSNVSRLYPSLNRDSSIVIKTSEEVKSYQGALKILETLVENKANVQTSLVVIGGGVLQDLIGFCASIYCRGIKYTLFPTTLLSQTDSCIGGKTSINLNSRKNILGTFYPPTEIIIYSDFINTLTTLDYYSGMGEIYKFYILQNKIKQFDIKGIIKPMILDGLSYKTDILSRDEFDKGERQFLNYGHTFGHAIESSSSNNIPHGLAVVLGCIIATRVAYLLGHKVLDYNEIINKGISLFKASGCVLKEDWFDFNTLINITKSDKKSTGKLTMVLVNDKPFLEIVENLGIVQKALIETYESI
jgi:3-dehydroquinate synthase